MRIQVGHYTVVFEQDGRLHALRDGQEWRDCVGDKLILSLAQEVDRLRTLVQSLRTGLTDQIQVMKDTIATGHVPSSFCPYTRKRESEMVRYWMEETIRKSEETA